MQMRSHRIVIVGGGAGGAELAVRLARSGEQDLLLIDSSPTHVWKPRLHELAAGAGRGHVDELDYAGLAEHWGFAFEQGELNDVDPQEKNLKLDRITDKNAETQVPERTIAYQALVLSLGGVTPDLGVDGVLENAVLLDRESDAEALFRRLSTGLLAGSLPGSDDTFEIVIVGSGATGVELAAFLTTDHLCASLAPRSAAPRIKVTLLEAMDEFMPGMPAPVRHATVRRLNAAGVAMETGQQVAAVHAGAVETTDGGHFPANLTVWATGRVGPPVAGEIESLATNKKRQWRVKQTLQTSAANAVFALGDCAYIENEPVAPTAQAASEQAQHLATELPRYLDGDEPGPFEFKDKGTLLSLGEAGTVGKTRGLMGNDLQIRGRLARAAYRGIQRQHQFVLLGPVRGTAEVLSNILGHTVGPRLKVH